MIVKAIKTKRITKGYGDIFKLINESLDSLKEGSVLAITSKVVAICEGRTLLMEGADKKQLVQDQSDYYLPAELSDYDFSFTILHNTLVPMSGIDESNGNGEYVLWPADPQKSANEIREYLVKKFELKNVGVVITDSTARPLHWGTEGVAVRYSGFAPTNDYINKPDLFGRPLKVTKSNVVDALASASVLVMGEGAEQTPIAIIEDLPFVEFQDRNPTDEEIKAFYIDHMHDDLFAPFLQNMNWQKGGRKDK